MIKVIELFSGIGAQRKALDNLGIPHEVIGISEIDKYALQSYEAIYGETQNFGDIRQIEHLPYADLWTYSSPCQDISVAGKQKGLSGGTRSGLLYEVGRLLEVAASENTLPKYLLLENVRNLVSNRFFNEFSGWLNFLNHLGYETSWKVLNAKEYGTPQNRERVYGISIRKDLKQKFTFPDKVELTTKLSDLLEEDVDEKYYVPYKKVEKLIGYLQNKEISNTIRVAGRSAYDKKHNWDCVAVREGTKKGYSEACEGDSINISFPTSTTRRGRVGKQVAQTLTTSPNQVVLNQVGNFLETSRFGGNPQDGRVYDKNGISPTLSTKQGPFVLNGYAVRRLTPLECWRLMGFDDESFRKAKESGVSDTQLYKQAGNSIVVGVLERIFKNLLG